MEKINDIIKIFYKFISSCMAIDFNRMPKDDQENKEAFDVVKPWYTFQLPYLLK